MQVTSAQAWVRGEESAHGRNETREGAGTGRGSQQGFFLGLLKCQEGCGRKVTHRSVLMGRGMCSRKESFSQLLKEPLEIRRVLDWGFDSCFGSPPGELVVLWQLRKI